MDVQIKHNYWIFDFSPYIFQVKNIPFNSIANVWSLVLIIGVFVLGYLLTFKFVHNVKLKETLQTTIVYSFAVLAILFGLHYYQVNWGLRWYSTMYLIGYLVFYFTCLWWIRKKQIMLNENLLVALIAYIIIGMLVGARFAYVFIYNWDHYKLHPLEAIATWQGGLSFHGGVVGIALAVIIFCRKYRIPFFHLTDKMAFITPIGIGFGRIGNFMNGELWGRPISSHVPWAIIFPEGGPLPRHPSQIYQSLGEGFGLFLTLFIISRVKQKEGTISACFLMFYCIYRFIVEFFREADAQVSYFYLTHLDWAPAGAYPDTSWWQMITMGQILCLIFFVCGLLMYAFTRKNMHEGSPQWTKRVVDYQYKLAAVKKE